MNNFTRKLFAYLLILAFSHTITPPPNFAWAGDSYLERTDLYSQPPAYPHSQGAHSVPAYPRPQPSAELMIFDGLVVRPLMLGVTLAGTALFVVTLPFSALGSNVDVAAEKLVVEPASWVFENCLGCLPPEEYRYGHGYHDPRMP